jgi:hypothetical protein
MSDDVFILGRQSAIAEAHALYRMLGHDGNTVEELRELTAVSPHIERALRTTGPLDGAYVSPCALADEKIVSLVCAPSPKLAPVDFDRCCVPWDIAD